MSRRIYQIDAFAAGPFEGNPAAVCLLPEPADEGWMQRVAMEMNLAETAFLVRGADYYSLRWFTPALEVDLCGHATLASAHMLWETGEEPPDSTLVFETRSGKLTARYREPWIEMDFPAEPDAACPPPAGLLEALGIEPEAARYVGRNRFDYIVELEDAYAVRMVQPQTVALSRIECRGVIVTAAASSAEYDFVSRFFAPAAGIPEDPATGSSHCCLAPYWHRRNGKETMLGFQASARGGIVRVTLVGNRVLLAGKAVTVMRGELLF